MLVCLIIPGILVAFLGSLYYLLPRGSGERVTYLASILLSEIMFLVMITQVVPQTKLIPDIAFMFLSLTIMLIAMMIAVLLIDKIQVYYDN
jgi:Neurotransmitter-gated ion-channel transmembrane region